MSYPTEAQVTAGVAFGAANELTGTGADAAALVATQLATDVAAVTAKKGEMLRTTTILGVTGDGLPATLLRDIRNRPLLKP